jgi:hypothetical protein
MANPIIWTDRSGNPRLHFAFSQDKVSAQLYEKDSNGIYKDTGIAFDEEDIQIETRNINELMRGITQEVFVLSDLSRETKAAILKSITRRTIEIQRGFSKIGNAMIIHALP